MEQEFIRGKLYYIEVICVGVETEIETGQVLVDLRTPGVHQGFTGVPVQCCGEVFYGDFWNAASDYKPELESKMLMEVRFVDYNGKHFGEPTAFVGIDTTYFGGCNVYTETLKDYSQIII